MHVSPLEVFLFLKKEDCKPLEVVHAWVWLSVVCLYYWFLFINLWLLDTFCGNHKLFYAHIFL